MNIDDKFELMALHRCLLEAKFNPHPKDRDIAGSPIVAKLVNDLIEELESIDGSGWREWRVAEKHQDRIEDLICALKKSNLSHLKEEDYEQFVINALAPLIAEKETVSYICEKVFN